MSSGAQQLREDFEQVQKLLESYPDIKIINTEGDPPEQYDIEYSIKGYKTEPDGKATPDDKHEVRINLPFGYPHFPPTAKPITPIFHPDIDPDAIRIADFWQQNNSLPELIIHIGQMICGKHYTTEEPFNQSAFEWFEERKTWLPFDILEPRDEDDTTDESKAEEAGESQAPEGEQNFVPASDSDLDILKDDIDFPFDDDDDPLAGLADEFSFGTDEETAEPEETEETEKPEESAFPVEEEDSAEDELDFGIDLGSDDASESFDLQEAEEEGLFDLESEDSSDELSFDIEDEAPEPEAEISEGSDLFDLDTEAPDTSEEDVATVTLDPEDPGASIEQEISTDEEPSGVDISLDDLAGIDEEGELDFGIADESTGLEEDSAVDLSGLEGLSEDILDEESADQPVDEEEEILASLSLNEESASQGSADEQSLAIGSLIDQKKIFTAKKTLTDHPEPESLPNHKEFELTIADAISEAEELFKTADKHEKKGEFEKAGIILDLVANIATDFPGLEMSRNKIRESMLGGGDQQKAGPEEEAKEKGQDKFIGEEEATPEKPRKKKKRSLPKFSFKIPVRLVAGIVVLVLLGGISAGVFFVYNGDDKKVQQAQATVQKAEEQITRKNFADAKQKLTAAQATLSETLFFQADLKERILKQIDSIRSSSLFREGLQGRVLHGDMYVTIETAKAIDKFNTQVSFAKKVLEGDKLDQAITAYEKSLPYAQKAGFEQEVKEVTRTISELRVKSALSKAEKAEKKLDWTTAKDEYTKALEQGKSILSPEEHLNIAKKMTAASYQYGLQIGLKAMNGSQWQTSIDAFQEIQKVFKAHPNAISEAEKIEIKKLLLQSQLYLYLAEAKKSFEQKIWQDAVATYNEAIALLQKNTEILGEEGKRDILMIEKTILTTHIAEKQNAIKNANQTKELKTIVSLYDEIVSLIKNSSFASDTTLASILSDAQKKTAELKDQLIINEQQKWLTDNYNKIFRENYPSSRSSEFMNPNVRFVKREENIMIFNISCTELKQGRKFRLELNYQHDLDKKTWSLFSGDID